jgi:predicted RNA-binding Zn ribbon-like protein
LDFANTVVYRTQPDRREDRLGTRANLQSWFAAAGLRGKHARTLREAIALREAIDRLFRAIAAREPLLPETWSTFINCYARFAVRHSVKPTAQGLVSRTRL